MFAGDWKELVRAARPLRYVSEHLSEPVNSCSYAMGPSSRYKVISYARWDIIHGVIGTHYMGLRMTELSGNTTGPLSRQGHHKQAQWLSRIVR